MAGLVRGKVPVSEDPGPGMDMGDPPRLGLPGPGTRALEAGAALAVGAPISNGPGRVGGLPLDHPELASPKIFVTGPRLDKLKSELRF